MLIESQHVQVWGNQSFRFQDKFQSALSVAFYNNLNAFNLMMATIENQTTKDFLLVISDDGSREDVVASVRKRLSEFRQPAIHLWQPDLGFRKNRMLNWFLHFANAEHLIFVDQDCLLHPKFVEEHQGLIEPHRVVSGRRVELTPFVSKLLSPEKVAKGYLQKNFWWIAPAIVWMKDANPGKGIYLNPGRIRDFLNRKKRDIVGCNFSISKSDLLSVNGFDTRYELPSTGEDSDLDFRLQGVGIFPKSAVFGPIQYHVWHKLTAKHQQNESLFEKVKTSGEYVTKFGYRQQVQYL